MPAITNPHMRECFHHHDLITSALKYLRIISESSKMSDYIIAGCCSNVAVAPLQRMSSHYYSKKKCFSASKITNSGSQKALQVEV